MGDPHYQLPRHPCGGRGLENGAPWRYRLQVALLSRPLPPQGRRDFMNFRTYLALLVLVATPALARDSLGMFESWGAFRDPGVPRCYAIAMADKPADARVDYRAYADVGHWPKRALRNQVHFRLSKRLAANAAIRLRVDTQEFVLAGGGGDAWAADRRMDAAIVAAMRSGKAMRVRATAADGRAINDFYTLPGAASAIDAAALGCAPAR